MNIEDMSDEEFEEFLNEWKKDADELDKKYALSSDSKHYSEKEEIKISKKLAEKLGSYNMSGIEILVNFDNLIKKELEMDSCTDEKRLAISEKMLSLGNLLTNIYKITKSHRSNDEKKEKIEELLGNVNILDFCAKLSDEIQKTREILINKARNATKSVQEEVVKLCKEVDKDTEKDSEKVFYRDINPEETEEKNFELKGVSDFDKEVFYGDINPEETEEKNFELKGVSDFDKEVFYGEIDPEASEEKIFGKTYFIKEGLPKRPSFMEVKDNKVNKPDTTISVKKIIHTPKATTSIKKVVHNPRTTIPERKKTKESTKSKYKKSMIEYKKLSFWGSLKRIIAESGKKIEEKIGIISKIKEVYNSKKTKKNDIEKSNPDDLDSKEDTIEKRNESKKNIFHAGKKSMEKIRNLLDEVLEDESGREVTPNIIANIMDRIAIFSKDKKIWGLCKGVAKDAMIFAGTLTYNVGDYVVDGVKSGIQSIKEAKKDELDR